MFRVKNYCRQCFVRYELLVNDYLSGSLGCKTRWQDDPTVLTEYNAQRSAQLAIRRQPKGNEVLLLCDYRKNLTKYYF